MTRSSTTASIDAQISGGSGRRARRHVVVIGGGITGTFAAYYLARAGATVTIVEPDPIGAHASGSNPGGLNPLHGPGIPGPLLDVALVSLRLHLQEWDRLRWLTRVDFQNRFTARLLVARGEAEAVELAGREALYNATPGLSARWLDADQLHRIEPRLSSEAIGALLTQGNARVQSASYTLAVAEAAARLGAHLVTGRATGLVARGKRVSAVRVDNDEIACDAAVIATGSWCREPQQWLGVELPVEPVKGEMLLAELDGVLRHDITWGRYGLYACSARQAWLGGTEERVGFDATPTSTARDRILDAVRHMLPALGGIRVIDHVAGLRPITALGLPMVGRSDAYPNVCLALGGGRKGMLLAPALGRAATELLLHGSTSMPVEHLAPGQMEMSDELV